MQCAIICDEGFEEIVEKELIQSYEVTIVESKKTVLIFTPKDKTNWQKLLAKLSYTFQSAIKILSHVKRFDATDLESVENTTTKDITKEYQKEIESLYEGPIKIACVRKGYHEYNSTDITAHFARTFFTNKDFSSVFSYFVYINGEEGYCGIDFAGRELHKRDYKIFLGAQTLRSTVAFNTFLASQVKYEDIVIDPFMGSGTIPIEAGLYFSKTSPFMFSKEKFAFTKVFKDIEWNAFFKEIDEKRSKEKTNIFGYDSLLKFLKNTQKNAKIADINKVITVSKVEVDWLDTKIESKTIDAIVTHPPLISENGSVTKILKVYKDFFKIADYLLKDKGTITILTSHKSIDHMIDIATNNGFKKDEEIDVYEGKEELVIGRFARG